MVNYAVNPGIWHYVKSVRIRNFWSIFSRIQTEYGPEKLRVRTLHAVGF